MNGNFAMCLFRTHLNTSDALGTQDVLHSFVPCASFFVFLSLFHFPPAVTDSIKNVWINYDIETENLSDRTKKNNKNSQLLFPPLPFVCFFLSSSLTLYGSICWFGTVTTTRVCACFFSIILERFCFVCHPFFCNMNIIGPAQLCVLCCMPPFLYFIPLFVSLRIVPKHRNTKKKKRRKTRNGHRCPLSSVNIFSCHACRAPNIQSGFCFVLFFFFLSQKVI